MGHAIDDLSSRSSNQHNVSKDSKSGILSSRSVKYLLLGGLAVSIESMERGAGKVADVARFSDSLPLSDVGLMPKISNPKDYDPLKTSCVEGIFAGLTGALIVQNPMPLLVGLGGCLPGSVAQQRIGNEFQVNTYTAGYQRYSSVASFGNGNFVVTWSSDGQDGSLGGIYSQIFNGNGNGSGIGNEFQVNTYTTDSQWDSSVASFVNGNFIVVWHSIQDGSSTGVYGQLFDNNANGIGNEFQINTYTSEYQADPAVASFSNGDFVVTWDSYLQDGSEHGVYGQLFDGNATRIGVEFQINTYVALNQAWPKIASFSNGNFVVTWESDGQDGSVEGIYGQVFNGNGNRIGNEFQVNTYTTDSQQRPSVAGFSDSNFVVTWNSNGQDGNGHGIYGQLFDSSTNRVGNEFQVNTYTALDQKWSRVAVFDDDNFVVTWHSDSQDGSNYGVYGQLFDSNANRIGNEFQVNTYTTNLQEYPSVASFGNGNFVVAWESEGQDQGVLMRITLQTT